LRLHCQKCGVENLEEVYFCLNCRSSLTPNTNYDLNVNDFIYGPDLDAIRTINSTGALPYVLKNLTIGDFEKTAAAQLSATAQRVTYPSDLDAIIRHCAVLLSLPCLPEVFIADSDQPNAYTFGSEEHAYMVIDSTLLRELTGPELTAVIAHEFGHVKSGHMLYHTLAEVLGGGVNLSASLLGLNLVSIPIRFALLSWQRESEVTADRTSLLVIDEIEVIRSLLGKLASNSRVAPVDHDETERSVGILESTAELFRTHRLPSNRFKLIKEFWQSEQYLKAKHKIQLRQRLLRGFMPVCRFCGAAKLAQDMFCPKCGKCQT
jgi:Zn-dependent protease with chaperone function